MLRGQLFSEKSPYDFYCTDHYILMGIVIIVLARYSSEHVDLLSLPQIIGWITSHNLLKQSAEIIHIAEPGMQGGFRHVAFST